MTNYWPIYRCISTFYTIRSAKTWSLTLFILCYNLQLKEGCCCSPQKVNCHGEVYLRGMDVSAACLFKLYTYLSGLSDTRDGQRRSATPCVILTQSGFSSSCSRHFPYVSVFRFSPSVFVNNVLACQLYLLHCNYLAVQ